MDELGIEAEEQATSAAVHASRAKAKSKGKGTPARGRH